MLAVSRKIQIADNGEPVDKFDIYGFCTREIR